MTLEDLIAVNIKLSFVLAQNVFHTKFVDIYKLLSY
jgi:hypothetical protein